MKDEIIIDEKVEFKDIENSDLLDLKDVKIVVNYTKYAKCYVHDLNHGIEIYCGSDELKTIDLIKQIIKDINNKQIKDYPYVAEVHIYASKENIEKIQENNDKRISNEYEIQRQINENQCCDPRKKGEESQKRRTEPESLSLLIFAFQVIRAKSLQLRPTLCDPLDCSPQVSSIHGIL